jgi:hypothetical protein
MINSNPGGNSTPICVFAREAVQYGIRRDFQRVTDLANVDINKIDPTKLQSAIKMITLYSSPRQLALTQIKII